MDKRELLAKFISKDITSAELSAQLQKKVPLIFELIDSLPMGEDIPLQAKGVYQDSEGNNIESTYEWYLNEAKIRDIAICVTEFVT
jgi:hypothetical protein